MISKLVDEINKHNLLKCINNYNSKPQVTQNKLVHFDAFTKTKYRIPESFYREASSTIKNLVSEEASLWDDVYIPNFDQPIPQGFEDIDTREFEGLEEEKEIQDETDDDSSTFQTIRSLMKQPLVPSKKTYEIWKSRTNRTLIRRNIEQGLVYQKKQR